MEETKLESIPIAVGIEENGRWWPDIATRESATTAVRVLALRVAADCIDRGEAIPKR